jgi:hypothetical protein
MAGRMTLHDFGGERIRKLGPVMAFPALRSFSERNYF